MRALLHELTLPSFRRYADRWGFDLRAVDLPADGLRADAAAQRAKWAKIDLLRRALADYPFAIWLDADVLLVRTDEDILTHLHPDDFQALALEQVPHEHRINPNTGVWVMRAGHTARAFLDEVERAGQQPGPWADQGAVLVALGWERGDEHYYWARPGFGSRFLQQTSWLPPSWNQAYLGGREDPSTLYNGSPASYLGRPQVPEPHAVHFMGMTPAARYQHVSQVLARQDAALAEPNAADRHPLAADDRFGSPLSYEPATTHG